MMTKEEWNKEGYSGESQYLESLIAVDSSVIRDLITECDCLIPEIKELIVRLKNSNEDLPITIAVNSPIKPENTFRFRASKNELPKVERMAVNMEYANNLRKAFVSERIV